MNLYFRNILLFLCLLPAVTIAADMETARDLFNTNCSACHGPNGKPDPNNPIFSGTGVMPANFTDALWSSREPSANWFTVIKHGGAARGFSEMMPSFKDALSDDEIRLLIPYLKTLAGDHDYPDGNLNFILPIRTIKAFPEDEVVWKFRHQEDGDNEQFRNVIEVEKRIGTRWQASLEVRHAVDDTVDNGHGNIDQIEPGIRYLFHEDSEAGSVASVGTLVAIPTEESSASVEWIPYLSAGKQLADKWTLQGTARTSLPAEDVGSGNVELSTVVHWIPSPNAKTLKPGLEVVASFPFDRESDSGDRSEFAQLSLIPQFQIGLNKRGHVRLNAAFEAPVNDTQRYDQRAYIYLLWDFADGGLFEGW